MLIDSITVKRLHSELLSNCEVRTGNLESSPELSACRYYSFKYIITNDIYQKTEILFLLQTILLNRINLAQYASRQQLHTSQALL